MENDLHIINDERKMKGLFIMKRIVIVVAVLASICACIYFMYPNYKHQSKESPTPNVVSASSPQEAKIEPDEHKEGEPADNTAAVADKERHDGPPERMKVTQPVLDFNAMTPEEKDIAEIENLLIDYLLGKADIENIKTASARLREVSKKISTNNWAYHRAGYSFALYYDFCREELSKAGIEIEPLDAIQDDISYSYMFHRYPGEKGKLFALQCLYTQQDSHLQEVTGSPYMLLQKIFGMNFSDNRDEFYIKMLNDMGLKEGMSVADIGGGLGRLTWIEKKIVGPKGHAYLAEIDYSCEDFIDYVKENQPDFKELGEVEFIKSNFNDPNLPGKMDCITFSEVHVLRDKDWWEWGHDYMKLLREKYLKPGGKVSFYEGLLNSDLVILGKDASERRNIVVERLTSVGYKDVTFSGIEGNDTLWIVIAGI